MKRKTKIIEEINGANDLADLKYICSKYEELNGKLDNYLDDDEAIEYIKNTCRDMIRLKYTIDDITDFNAEYYYLDNYGNLSNIDETLDNLKDDLVNEL